ncbi:MAG: methyltransferase domain-containing protein [Chloroflexi bacterium]|nr:methyltransferase domain-containing protein [Chloroflexota bacterium]
MNWHARYLQQAAWTRGLRHYLFEKAGLEHAVRALEVGCGTGAILREIGMPIALHGLDLNPVSLSECRAYAPGVFLTRGDGHHLPYADKFFDIAFCHFLLLWVHDPIQVVREMARVSRVVLALAEPDYSARVDKPLELKHLGAWQTESLRRQGANPSFGSLLAETFHQAGIRLIETGPIQSGEVIRSAKDWEDEWAVIEADLDGMVPGADVQRMKTLDESARKNGTRILHVPAYFAWGEA